MSVARSIAPPGLVPHPGGARRHVAYAEGISGVVLAVKWRQNKMTRRAGCLSWTRRVIRCQGKSSRRGLATYLEFLRRNVNFWSSSIRSNFDFILFPEIIFWDGKSELGPEILYRLFSGWKFEKLTAKFFEKIEKSEKIEFFKNFLDF